MISFEYLAGLIDGEGNIRLAPSNKGKYKKYYPRVRVTNTYFPLMIELEKQFGGKIKGPTRGHWSTKDIYNWCISGDTARYILKQTLPFLIIKKEIAEYVLEKDQKQGA